MLKSEGGFSIPKNTPTLGQKFMYSNAVQP